MNTPQTLKPWAPSAGMSTVIAVVPVWTGVRGHVGLLVVSGLRVPEFEGPFLCLHVCVHHGWPCVYSPEDLKDRPSPLLRKRCIWWCRELPGQRWEGWEIPGMGERAWETAGGRQGQKEAEAGVDQAG